MLRTTLVILGLITVALTGCSAEPKVDWQADGTPVFSHPHQTWWSYKFVYHPNDQVYFDPYSGMYHWLAAGEWWSGSALPESIVLDPEQAVIVHMQTERPYVQHGSVLAWHPPHTELSRWDGPGDHRLVRGKPAGEPGEPGRE